ncbi:S1C family serine protease [Arthrobacter sp. AQ5-05]|uniref:S1C family serine protease n=1 Tax=Arthrobacter sp. AQ5-05 TaxID=2184581 RepID=UPI0012B635CE|nr:trypsin-like peptidase domain-containing protein [Arthrobacter sp. AQ5-05]
MSENTGGETNNSQGLPDQAPQESTPETAQSASSDATDAATSAVPATVWNAPETNLTERITSPTAPETATPEPPNQTLPIAQPAPAWQTPYAAAQNLQNPAPNATQGGHHTGAGYPASNAYPHTLAPAVTARPKERKKVGMGLFAASVLAAALVGGLAAGGTALVVGQDNANKASSNSQQVAPLVINNTSSVNQVSAAAAKAMPSVVTISATSGTSGGTGSGIILDTAGHILTNTHVVTLDGEAAHATIQVQTSDGKVFAGSVVGTDPLSDLAIVKIDAPNLVPATLGDSNKINVGDTVIAIGSPLGLNATVTEGIISTLNRTIQVASSAVPSTPSDTSPDQGNGGNGYQFSPPGGGQSSNKATGTVNLNVIQTDAAINPGNSGGALVDAQGQIIGVNVAIASTGSSSSSTSQGGNIGVGFSIPIDHAKRIADEIIATGKATHGQLGVSVSGASALGSNSQFSAGATVADVTAGSAAAKAGLQKGDVITELAGRTISDASSLTAAVREQAGGATVKVTLTRNETTMEKDVTLDTMPAG